MSGRGTHYAAGAVLGLLVGELGRATIGWQSSDVMLLTAIATGTAGGELSCDVDQFGWWRKIRKGSHQNVLGRGGPMQHRGITHWIWWPPIMAVVWTVALLIAPVLDNAWWLGWGIALGWGSHVIMDALYGHEVRTPQGVLVVHRGVPFKPWWDHRGGIWTSSGYGSRGAGAVLTVVALGQSWLLIRGSA